MGQVHRASCCLQFFIRVLLSYCVAQTEDIERQNWTYGVTIHYDCALASARARRLRAVRLPLGLRRTNLDTGATSVQSVTSPGLLAATAATRNGRRTSRYQYFPD